VGLYVDLAGSAIVLEVLETVLEPGMKWWWWWLMKLASLMGPLLGVMQKHFGEGYGL
jgi:hypothetical protein